MKKIKKLLIPAACIAASAGAVLPLVTSCNKSSISYTDVTKGYTPKGEKHASGTLTTKQAFTDYKKAIKENPNIASEDYKFFGAQLVEYLNALFADLNDNAPSKVTIERMRVGLNNFVLDDKTNKVSYSNGIDLKVAAEIDYTEKFGVKLSGVVELNLVNNLVNFSGLEIQHHSNRFIDNWTLIQPIWPANLTDEDWSYTFHLAGNINLKINDYDLLNLKGIDLTHRFDYNNCTLLQLMVADSTYLLDVFQLLSSFESYYLSDVTIKSHAAGPHYAEFYYDNGYSWGTSIPYTLDESNYDEDLFNIEGITIDNYWHLEISDTDPKSAFVITELSDYRLGELYENGDQRITFLINYENEDRDESNAGGGGIPSFLETYKWSESHTVWPRFHLDDINQPKFNNYALYGCDFSGDHVFTKDATSTTAAPVTFSIVDPNSPTTIRKIEKIVEITLNGQAMDTSKYTFANDIVTFADGVAFKANDKVEVHFTFGETEFKNLQANWTTQE